MEYIQLGKSDLKVSRICMGCMGFGNPEKGFHKWTLPYEDTKKIIAHAFDNGINFYDTAMAYQSGTSEEFIGKAFRELGKLNDVIIATKYTPRNSDELLAKYTGEKWIAKCIDDSLERLQRDYIDLYIMHSWDYETPVEETLKALTKAHEQGKIRAIGVSNCYAWQLAKANALAEQYHLQKFVSIQSHYNLIMREDERELMNYCKEDNIALTPYSALAAGRLSKRPGETSKRLQLDTYAKFKYDATEAEDEKIIQRVAEIADEKGVSMTEVSLAWLLSKVDSPVVGATKTSHIDGAVNAVNLKLSQSEIEYLEELYVPHALSGVMAQKNWKKQVK